MGEVVSLESYRRARQPRPVQGARSAPVERLAEAVERLESALRGLAAQGYDELELRRELIALNGAVGLGRYAFAAERTERLVERLRSG